MDKIHRQAKAARWVRVVPFGKTVSGCMMNTKMSVYRQVKSLPLLLYYFYSLAKHDKPGNINYLAAEIESKWLEINLSSDVNI